MIAIKNKWSQIDRDENNDLIDRDENNDLIDRDQFEDRSICPIHDWSLIEWSQIDRDENCPWPVQFVQLVFVQYN